jgi:hypothetical protein
LAIDRRCADGTVTYCVRMCLRSLINTHSSLDPGRKSKTSVKLGRQYFRKQRFLVKFSSCRGHIDINTVNNVTCTLVQALRPCIGGTDRKGNRGIALLFMTTALEGGEGQRHAPAALYPRERPGTHCTGGCMDPRAGLDRCGKSHLPRDSIPGLSSP